MIGFFRKIRKKLADDNKPLKYMRYAIGEIVLVMFGILLALQVNNWNEERKDREKEQKVLETLAYNLERNSILLHEALGRVEELNKSGKIVFNFFEGKETFHDTLDNHFNLGKRNGVMQGIISHEGYENYKNAGFDIILSDAIKTNVLHLFEVEYPHLEAYRQLLVMLTNKSSVYDLIWTQHFRNNKPINIINLLKSNEMYEMFRVAQSTRSILTVELNKALDNTEKVLQLIKDELGKE